MECQRCGNSTIFLAHDAQSDRHVWEEEAGELGCVCQPEPVCAICEASRVRSDGLLLLPRPLAMRAVASGSQLRH